MFKGAVPESLIFAVDFGLIDTEILGVSFLSEMGEI